MLSKSSTIFFLIFSLIVLLAGQEAFFGDPYLYCGLVDQWLFRGQAGLALDSNLLAHANKYGVLNSAYCIPGLAAKYFVSNLEFSKFVVAIWPALISILCAFGFTKALSLVRQESSNNWIFSGLLLLTTPLIVYSRNYYSEIIQATLLIWAYYFWLQFKMTEVPKQRYSLIKLTLACSLLVLCKLYYLYLVALLFLAIIKDYRQNYYRTIGTVSIASLCFLPTVAILLLSNYWKFGSVIGIGYNLERDLSLGFNTPLLTGLYGLLFSSGKGIIWYVPVLILLPFLLVRDWLARREQACEILFITTPLLIIIASWWAWHGDWGWAPRLIVPLIPLWMLLLGSINYTSIAQRWLFVVFCLFGAFINFSAVLISPMYYFKIMTQKFESLLVGKDVLQDGGILLHYAPDFSPIKFQLWAIQCKLAGSSCNPNLPWEYLKIKDLTLEQVAAPQWDPILLFYNPSLAWIISLLFLLLVTFLLQQFMRHFR